MRAYYPIKKRNAFQNPGRKSLPMPTVVGGSTKKTSTVLKVEAICDVKAAVTQFTTRTPCASAGVPFVLACRNVIAASVAES